MTETPDQLTYAERFTRAAQQCRSAAQLCRNAIDQVEELKRTLGNIGALYALDPDDFDRRRPHLLQERGVPSPAGHHDALNQLRFTLHGLVSVWDAEADYYVAATPIDEEGR